jgi:hypothetical protein
MLKRLAAPAVAFVLGATIAIALPSGTALADCHTDPNGVITCDASDSGGQNGSGGGDNNSGGSGNGGNTGPGNGCQNQGNGQIGQGCTAGAPAARQAPAIPAVQWAAQARSQLQPPPPAIRWTPEPRTYVQLRTGLWIEPATFETLHSPPAGAGAEQVVATATPQRVEWNLVETTIDCPNAGSSGGTQCGYTYQRSSAGQPGGKYQITATVVYEVTWNCRGDCDQLSGTLDDLPMSATAQLPVDEIQTESQPG